MKSHRATIREQHLFTLICGYLCCHAADTREVLYVFCFGVTVIQFILIISQATADRVFDQARYGLPWLVESANKIPFYEATTDSYHFSVELFTSNRKSCWECECSRIGIYPIACGISALVLCAPMHCLLGRPWPHIDDGGAVVPDKQAFQLNDLRWIIASLFVVINSTH